MKIHLRLDNIQIPNNTGWYTPVCNQLTQYGFQYVKRKITNVTCKHCIKFYRENLKNETH